MSTAPLSTATKRRFENGGAVRAVSVASTGTGELHAEHVYGSRKNPMLWIFFGKKWIALPINFYVIEHENGLVLFDAGQDRAVVTDPDYWPRGFTGTVMRKLFKISIGPDEILPRQLERLGYSLSDISKVVFSHLHADHIGRIQELLHADLIVSDREWDHMLERHSERHMIFRNYIEIAGAKWNRISFEAMDDPDIRPFTHGYDLMGDGSMMLLPTPGHTPGSMSMLARPEEGPPLLLAGDLSYQPELLERDQLPGTGEKRDLLDSFAKVRALRERMPNLALLFSHDARAASILGGR
jgi:glyoxylase-like metal-dependent hydrolase (beta-lactamase superfamily II)